MSQITIATAPCSWGVWYADGSPSQTPYEIFLDQAASAGYKGIELGPDGYLPTEEGKLGEELAKRGLEVCAGTVCYAFDRESSFAAFLPQVEALCKRLKVFHAAYLVAMDESDVGDYSEKKAAMTTEEWLNFLEKINALGKYTKNEFGIEVVYHPHIKSMIETEAEIIRLLDFTGLNLCFDIGHYAYVNSDLKPEDTDVIDFIRRHQKRLAYLHFKNVDYQVRKKVYRENLDSDTAFDLNVMCDLKAGMINYEGLRDVLQEISFDGIGVIEQDMPKATTAQAFAAAKRNLSYLQEIQMID